MVTGIPLFLLRLTHELHYHLHLIAGEIFALFPIPHCRHGLPHAARLMHLLTKEAQGTIVVMVRVIHLCKVAERVVSDFKLFSLYQAFCNSIILYYA